jgi:hypothetical protein
MEILCTEETKKLQLQAAVEQVFSKCRADVEMLKPTTELWC